MDSHILIAIVGALLNMVLSVTMPCIIKKTDQPFLSDVKKVYETNRELLLTSSLIVAITIYLALKVTPELNLLDDDFSLGSLTESNDYNNYDNTPIMAINNTPPEIRNLIKLMQR